MASLSCLALLLTSLVRSRADTSQCTMRNCLPTDNTQNPPLCYVKTALAESYAKCSDNQVCDACLEEPPCESFCASQPRAMRQLGESCMHDWECAGGPFARCLQRICRKALHTFQYCVTDNPHDICIFGQKSCFRNKCQGLKTGDYCWEGYPEGRDIDCNPGWYCFLGKCTPQLPKGHECTGQHPRDCIRGYRCNMAMEVPRCTRQYTLDIGEASSEGSLCKSNHVDPRVGVCAAIPAVLFSGEKPVVLSQDCYEDTDCPRADGSLGQCRCKIWWEGEGAPGYCELAVQDSNRPAFKRFWARSMTGCHHDWDEDRCAIEIGREDTLLVIRQELVAKMNDPTTVKDCAGSVLAQELAEAAHTTPRTRSPCWLAWLVLLAL